MLPKSSRRTGNRKRAKRRNSQGKQASQVSPRRGLSGWPFISEEMSDPAQFSVSTVLSRAKNSYTEGTDRPHSPQCRPDFQKPEESGAERYSERVMGKPLFVILTGYHRGYCGAGVLTGAPALSAHAHCSAVPQRLSDTAQGERKREPAQRFPDFHSAPVAVYFARMVSRNRTAKAAGERRQQ